MADLKNIFSEEGLIAIFQNSHDAFIVSDSVKKIIYSNTAAQNIFGYSETEMSGMSILKIMPEDRQENYSEDMKSALNGNIVSNIDSGNEFFGQRKNGEIFHIELTYVCHIFNENNYFVSQIRDISGRKKIEADLKAAINALKIINEANRILIKADDEFEYLKDICKIITALGGYAKALVLYLDEKDGKLIQNPVAFSGYEPGAFEKQDLTINFSSESPSIIALNSKKPDICQNISARGLWKYWVDDPGKMQFESTIALPLIGDGQVFSILRVYSFQPSSFSKHEVELLEELTKDMAYGISVLRSRTVHEKTRKALEESEQKYKGLFQSSNDAIFIVDAETSIITDANTKAEELLGLGIKEIIGMHYYDISPEGYEEKYKNLFSSYLDKGINISDEFYIRTKKEEKAVLVQISANVAFISGKKVIQGIARDISKSKMEEEKIRATQKMEALGTLSGGIAHDINNILSPIIGFTQLAILEPENKEKVVSYLNEVLTASNRAKELVAQILTFCHNNETDKKPHFIQNIVKEVVKLISISTPPDIELQTVIDDNCEPVYCDPIQIYQIIINLCTNASYAMKDNAGILKVCLVRKGSKEIKIEPAEILPFDDFICLIVSDTGCGMNKKTLDRIFEPYFSTKPKEEGTGLGLSVVSGIVKEHSGTIYVRTYPKEGTYFRILFPVTSHSLTRSEEKKLINDDKNKLNIMVVDDEPQITFMLKHMLEELGYTSETFNESLSALESFKADPQKYDLVITDQTMPKLLGTELSKKILEIKPSTPIILNTGFSPVASRSEAKKIGIKKFMMKPIAISDLEISITEALKNPENKNVKHIKYI